jgi:hypothetical protein
MALARFSRLALTSCVAVGHDAFNSAETAGVRDMREAYQANICSNCVPQKYLEISLFWDDF